MILAIILVICHAAIDWYRIEKLKKQIDHLVGTALFALASAIGTMIVLNWWFVVLCFGVRFLLFDYALNIMRGKKWHYLGKEAMSDRVISKLNKWIVLALRTSGFGIACWLYYN